MQTKYKRRIYFIEKRFQANFILKFCALVAVGGLLTIGTLYLFAMQSTTVSIVNSRVLLKTTADFLLPVLIQTVFIVMIIVSICTIVVTLFVSHKIAGPLYRLKKTMQELESGNFSGNFKIRHLDQLQDLADTFNNMIVKLRQVIDAIKNDFLSLKSGLDNILENEVSEQKRPLLGELKKLTVKLSNAFHYFKTQC